MKANFSKALKAVLVHEGGYVNYPKDPGGATNFGVTQKVYNAWRVKRGEDVRPVKQIDKAEVAEIYRKNYWDAVQGDDMPNGVDYVLFDGAVNSGPLQAIKWLQRSLDGYTGAIDGVMGLRTLRRVMEDDDNDALITRMCTHRMAFLKVLKTWPVFGKGWSKRVAGVEAMGLAMASGKQAPKIAFVPDGAAKAPEAEVAVPPAKGGADAATGVGGAQDTRRRRRLWIEREPEQCVGSAPAARRVQFGDRLCFGRPCCRWCGLPDRRHWLARIRRLAQQADRRGGLACGVSFASLHRRRHSSPFVVAIVGGLIGAGLGSAGWHFLIVERYRDQGRAEIRAQWNAAIVKERDREAEIAREMEEEYAPIISDMREAERRSQELIAELRAEAAKDPDAARPALSPAALERVNRLRKKPKP